MVNPLSVKKQLEGQIIWFYNDAMHQANTIKDGHIVENNFNKFRISRSDDAPPEINIRFFKTGHCCSEWARPLHFGPIRHRRCNISNYRQALPGSAVGRSGFELGRAERRGELAFRL